MTTHLTLVKHRLPPLWDGYKVEWDQFTVQQAFVCPPAKQERCDGCGSRLEPEIATGLRHPKPGETTASTKTRTGRFGRPVQLPVTVPAWPLRDLTAFRCRDCGQIDVWDQRGDEWWTLDESDFGPEGSSRPNDWGTGGLFDLLTEETR